MIEPDVNTSSRSLHAPTYSPASPIEPSSTSTSTHSYARSTITPNRAGHGKIAGKQILRKGLSPLVTIISAADSHLSSRECVCGQGTTGSGTGAARMIDQAVTTARMVGATGKIIVCGNSAYGNSRVVRACINARVKFSFAGDQEPSRAASNRLHRRPCVDTGGVSRLGA